MVPCIESVTKCHQMYFQIILHIGALGSEFLNLYSTDILAYLILCCEGYPVDYRMFSRILDLY